MKKLLEKLGFLQGPQDKISLLASASSDDLDLFSYSDTANEAFSIPFVSDIEDPKKTPLEKLIRIQEKILDKDNYLAYYENSEVARSLLLFLKDIAPNEPQIKEKDKKPIRDLFLKPKFYSYLSKENQDYILSSLMTSYLKKPIVTDKDYDSLRKLRLALRNTSTQLKNVQNLLSKNPSTLTDENKDLSKKIDTKAEKVKDTLILTQRFNRIKQDLGTKKKNVAQQKNLAKNIFKFTKDYKDNKDNMDLKTLPGYKRDPLIKKASGLLFTASLKKYLPNGSSYQMPKSKAGSNNSTKRNRFIKRFIPKSKSRNPMVHFIWSLASNKKCPPMAVLGALYAIQKSIEQEQLQGNVAEKIISAIFNPDKAKIYNNKLRVKSALLEICKRIIKEYTDDISKHIDKGRITPTEAIEALNDYLDENEADWGKYISSSFNAIHAAEKSRLIIKQEQEAQSNSLKPTSEPWKPSPLRQQIEKHLSVTSANNNRAYYTIWRHKVLNFSKRIPIKNAVRKDQVAFIKRIKKHCTDDDVLRGAVLLVKETIEDEQKTNPSCKSTLLVILKKILEKSSSKSTDLECLSAIKNYNDLNDIINDINKNNETDEADEADEAIIEDKDNNTFTFHDAPEPNDDNSMPTTAPLINN